MSALAYHMQGKHYEWETPQSLFDSLNRLYRFTLDVCASEQNTKCKRFFTRAQNGLTQRWAPNTCWMNPPYGRDIREWMRKAFEESKAGASVVCLVPARTDAGWWHEYAMKGGVEFLRGRLKFGGAKHSAPFPCALIVFRSRA